MTGLAKRLEQCHTGAVFDVLRGLGSSRRVLPPTVRPLDPRQRLAGRVFTVSGRRVDGADPHETLLAWTAFLAKVPPDSVVICQPNDSTLAHMGELSAETLKYRGVRGYIVDGGCRDSEFIVDAGVKVWCQYFTPADIVGRWVCDQFEEAIRIGDVTIETGDYVLADRDGVVIIPGKDTERVVTATERVLETESLVRKAILQGMDPQEAYLRYGKF